MIQQRVSGPEDYSKIFETQGTIKVAEPIMDIYEFSGVFKMRQENEKLKESLKLENTLWANTVLASSQILGLVAYTGKETRMALNSRQPRSKFGRLDLEINFLSKLLFLIMIILSMILVFVGATNYSWELIILFNRYVILLSQVIPISLRVNLDFAKIIYCIRINSDKGIEGTVSRTSQIPEELGRIEYLLSDKTGTLTQNDMIFKRLSLESQSYTYENVEEISNKIKQECQKGSGPYLDHDENYQSRSQTTGNQNSLLKPQVRIFFSMPDLHVQFYFFNGLSSR